MPQQIELSADRSIQNMYATDGRKLKTTVKEGEELMDGTKYYNANFVFDKQKEMDYILFDEGRIVNYGGNLEYEYHLKDHLASVRVVFVPTVNGKEVVQENAYYPFGATIGDLSYAAPLSNNRYGYTGQEQLNDFDLNWYDYIARNYNPLIGRFNSIDPLAEKYYSISPYAYCNNNPVRFIDPTGMTFNEANEKIAQKIERKLDKQIIKLEQDIARIEKKGGDIGDRKDRVGQMRQSKNDIADMRGSQDIEFRYAKTSGDPQTTGNSNVVTMHVNGDFGIQLHESSHGGQVARGDYNFDSNGNPTDGDHVACEVDAYKAQYSPNGGYNYKPANALDNPAIQQAFDIIGFNAIPMIEVNNLSQINAAMVNNIGVPAQLTVRGRTYPYIKPLYPPAGMTKTKWSGQ